MTSSSFLSSTCSVLLALTIPRIALGQTAPVEPAEAAEDDLEISATPEPAPSAPPSAPATEGSEPAPPSAPAASTAAPKDTAATTSATAATTGATAATATAANQAAASQPNAGATVATTPPAAEPAKPAATDQNVTGLLGVQQSLGIPEASAPIGSSIAPASLDAEGSNYTRPLRSGFRWWGFVQAQFQTNQISEDQLDANGEWLNRDEFGVRRARIRLDHGWKATFATLELDAGTLGGPPVRLRRAEASLLYRGDVPEDVVPLVVFTGGVTDIPFGAELGESQRDRLFMERSIGSTALFGAEADLGAKLWGGYRFLNYAVAFINGEPPGPEGFSGDPNSHKDFAGRVGVDVRPEERVAVTGGISFYTGKGTSPGTLATKDSIDWVDVNNNGVAEPTELYGVTGSAATPSQNFDRWALGFDAGGSVLTPVGISRLNTELYLAENLDRTVLPSDPIVSGVDARQFGLSLGYTQTLLEYGLLGFRAAFYDPNSDLFEQRAGVFHLTNQTYWVLSPALGVTVPHGRFVAQYDFVIDRLGRDASGVPDDARNDQFTARLQVDL